MARGKHAMARTPQAPQTPTSPTPNTSLALLRELLMNEGEDTEAAITTNSASKNTSALLHQLDIGGLDGPVITLLRRALASRLLSPDMAKRLGVKHVRGILLHGPPGTGKTLVARQLAALLHAAKPKLISGPELLSMWVGKSEENIRAIFQDAEQEFKEKGSASALHVIIFDEIDALTRKRGTLRDSSGVLDSCVNQLLSKIDGLAAFDNILCIGTTNRKDLLDDALLRPGRLEVHVEVGLPDEAGRAQIFHIHTRGFANEGCLSADVDFHQLARLTPNFTGAEIEGVVKGGLSFALQRQVSRKHDVLDADVIKSDLSSSKLNLCMLDLLRALREAKPHFGAASQQWATHQRMGFVAFRPEVPTLVQGLLTTLDQARNGGQLPLVTILLQGPPGAGKSAVLAHLGSLAGGFTFRRHLTGQELASLGEEAACDTLAQAVQDAHQCPHSLLMLDDLEGLSQYVPLQGGRVSLPRLHSLLAVLGRTPAKMSRVGVVLATTSLDQKTLCALGLWEKFSVRVALPLVETAGHVAALLGKGEGAGKSTMLRKEENGPWTVRELLQRQALNTEEEKKIEEDEGSHN
ncbi:hypothetical protein VYU27_006439 [Nannochloropsis oceanica]